MAEQSLRKPRIKRERITGRYSSVTQDKILAFLTEDNDENVFIHDATECHHVTPDRVREKGIIVCSECGHYNSDSVKTCKFCHDPLVYIRPTPHPIPNSLKSSKLKP